MTGPTPSDLLDAWELGLGLPASERCLPLLAAAGAGASADQVAELPIGERDARLLELREWAFGRSMTGTARCPSCGADLELPVDVHQVRVGGAGGGVEREAALTVGDHDVRFRLPDSHDVREAAQAGTVDAAREVLLHRCVIGATRDGAAVEPGALPAAVVDRVESAMAERDAQADVRLALACPDCKHEWEAGFDVGVYLWGEIDQWARRLLLDVATLASAYGWTEAEVLRLGPARRQAYLELAAR
jgi:hypothetical protein